jgi:hypothetical protein
MDGTQTGGAAARELAAARWGASRPVRLARELELRAHELPDLERVRLIAALTRREAGRGVEGGQS